MNRLRTALIAGTVVAGVIYALVRVDTDRGRETAVLTRLRISSGSHLLDVHTTVNAEFAMTGGTLTVERGKRLEVKGNFYLGKNAEFTNNGTLVIGEPGKQTTLHVEPRIRTWTTQERDANWKYSCNLDDCHVTQTGGYNQIEHSEQYTPSLGDIILQ